MPAVRPVTSQMPRLRFQTFRISVLFFTNLIIRRNTSVESKIAFAFFSFSYLFCFWSFSMLRLPCLKFGLSYATFFFFKSISGWISLSAKQTKIKGIQPPSRPYRCTTRALARKDVLNVSWHLQHL